MATLSRRTKTSEGARARGLAGFLSATTELLAEGNSYGELGIETICKAAGFSRASFYLYFEHKRDLLIQLGRQAEAEVYEAADDWLRDGRGSPRVMLTATLAAFKRHRPVVAALIETATYDAEMAVLWRTLHDRFRAAVAGHIRAVQPELDPSAAEARAFTLAWLTERACFEHVSAPVTSDDDFLDAMELLWNAAHGAPA